MMYTRLDADQSAAVLERKIRMAEPFFFVRYGDGALECLQGKKGRTCDHEVYSADLAAGLLSAWQALMAGENVFVGDWLSASFDEKSEYARYEEDYSRLIGSGRPAFLQFEALLLMRESRALVDFYRAVKQDPRKKLYMGPQDCWQAARMLDADHLPTPMGGIFGFNEVFEKALIDADFEILLFGAGMAVNIPVVECWKKFPQRTYVNVGSAFDPLFRGRTRRQQLTSDQAKNLFKELL